MRWRPVEAKLRCQKAGSFPSPANRASQCRVWTGGAHLAPPPRSRSSIEAVPRRRPARASATRAAVTAAVHAGRPPELLWRPGRTRVGRAGWARVAALHGWVRAIAVREAVRTAHRAARTVPADLSALPARGDPRLGADIRDVLERLSPEHRAVHRRRATGVPRRPDPLGRTPRGQPQRGEPDSPATGPTLSRRTHSTAQPAAVRTASGPAAALHVGRARRSMGEAAVALQQLSVDPLPLR